MTLNLVLMALTTSGLVSYFEAFFLWLAERSVLCVGKDYSNPRVQDFHTLNKPHEDMYDRSKVPRMPWWVEQDDRHSASADSGRIGTTSQCRLSDSLPVI